MLERSDTASAKDRVLVVEDDRDVAELVKTTLEDSAAQVDNAYDGRTGLAMAESGVYDLIVLDLMLPLLSGLRVCELLRSGGSDIPILATTARGDLVGALLGVDRGFDEYVLKPYDLADLRAASKRLLERRGDRSRMHVTITQTQTISSNECVTLDDAGRNVVIERSTVAGLSPHEREVLSFLMRHNGEAFSSAELLAAIWGLHEPVLLRHLGVDLARLRSKLVGPRSGRGYLLAVDEDRYMILARGEPRDDGK